jgi:lysophospholipase L1-like esterase
MKRNILLFLLGLALSLLSANRTQAQSYSHYFPLIFKEYCANQNLTLNFLAYGDSITGCYYDSYYGWHDDPNYPEEFPGCGYERRVYDRLKQQYGFCPGKLAFFNYGVGGQTTRDGWLHFYDTITNPTQDLHRLYPADATVTSSNLILIMEGTNDMNQGVDDITIGSNLDNMVSQAIQAGKRVIIATIPPNFSPYYIESQNRIPDFNNIYIGGIASFYNIPVADVYSRLADHPDWMADDGLHPNGAGFDQMADVFYQAIVDLMFP